MLVIGGPHTCAMVLLSTVAVFLLVLTPVAAACDRWGSVERWYGDHGPRPATGGRGDDACTGHDRDVGGRGLGAVRRRDHGGTAATSGHMRRLVRPARSR